MYVCKAYLWNKESLMDYNLERKQRELKYLFDIYTDTFCDDSISMLHWSPRVHYDRLATK